MKQSLWERPPLDFLWTACPQKSHPGPCPPPLLSACARNPAHTHSTLRARRGLWPLRTLWSAGGVARERAAAQSAGARPQGLGSPWGGARSTPEHSTPTLLVGLNKLPVSRLRGCAVWGLGRDGGLTSGPWRLLPRPACGCSPSVCSLRGEGAGGPVRVAAQVRASLALRHRCPETGWEAALPPAPAPPTSPVLPPPEGAGKQGSWFPSLGAAVQRAESRLSTDRSRHSTHPLI